MSYPTAPGLVWMTCQGDYDKHGFYGESYNAWVPFVEAIHNPPLCHGAPRIAEGARRMRDLERAWVELGPELDCRFSGKGEGQGVSCFSHGWSGVYHDLLGEYEDWTCPSQPIAAWLFRRRDVAA